jgi:hypothetical protein
METETNDITPEIARQMTQEALDWDAIVQKEINDRVPDTAKAGKRECRIVIEPPNGMTVFTRTTQDIIKRVFLRKGWKIKDFAVVNFYGSFLVDIEW